MNMKKAAIFDLDGTIAETLESLAYCSNIVLEEFGFAPIAAEHFRTFVGDGAAMQMKRALEYDGCTDDAVHSEVLKRYLEIFRDNCMYHVTPCPGVPSLLQELHRKGIRCAVLSNKPHERTIDVVDHLYPEGTFDMIRGQIDGFPKKPAPDGAVLIASGLSVKPEDCLYLGDTNTDMLTGKHAGMFTVGVLWGFRSEIELKNAGADVIASAPAEVLDYLE